MKHFLNVNNVDIDRLVERAMAFKQNPFSARDVGADKTMVLVFLNPSLRTRLSTQKAARNLGMECIVLNVGSEGWQIEFDEGVVMDGTKAEHIREAAAVISSYADVIGIRTFAGLSVRPVDYSEFILSRFVKYATVPIVNMESATVHPLQSLADLMTIRELQEKPDPKVVLTWAPHPRALPQAVANSFVEWMRSSGTELVIANPPGYDLAPEFTQGIPVLHDQSEALKGADFVYAKNWSSYEHYGQVLDTGKDWTLTGEKMALTQRAKFLHCLPVRRNVVVSDEVIDCPQSAVIQQAANREWAAQAVLENILLDL